MSVLRLARTVRHLRPVQIYGRALHRMTRPSARLGPPPPLRPRVGDWAPPIEKPAALLGPGLIRFLNETGGIESAQAWNDLSRPKLWLYNLHYFDELAAAADPLRDEWRRALIDRWIAENPVGDGNGWEPYPISLRVVNWIKWSLGRQPLSPAALGSLAVQLRWLEQRLERHLLGNHLFANAKALLFGGLFFAGDEGDRWRNLGQAVLARELPEQVLADGGHFERSPMYHAILLEDVLDLVNLARTFGAVPGPVRATWETTAGRMQDWLAAMAHPDGDIAFFNDAAFGVAAKPAALQAYAARLDLPPINAPDQGATDLAPSGYVRLSQAEAVVLIDAAPVGPDYLPGHAHADTLSFELSLGTERIIVNGGTSVYAEGADRVRERGTAAHSTVEIDGQDSSEVWAAFRVGRRARVTRRAVSQAGSRLEVTAAHDGYRALPGRPVHQRSWTLTPNALVIEDRVNGERRQGLARFHLPPSVSAGANDGRLHGTLRTAAGREIRWNLSAPGDLRPSTWSPEFGRRLATQALVAPVGPEGLRTEFRW